MAQSVLYQGTWTVQALNLFICVKVQISMAPWFLNMPRHGVRALWSHCFTAGGLSGELNPLFFIRWQWVRLDWGCAASILRGFQDPREALSKLVWPHSCPHTGQEAGLRSLAAWIILCGTGSILCDSLSSLPERCLHSGAVAVSVRWWLFYSTIHKEWLWIDRKYGQI